MDDHMGDLKNHAWWKGSFPTWIVAGLLGLLGFFVQRELKTVDHHRKESAKVINRLQIDVTDLKARMIALEKTSAENHQLLGEISRNLFPWKGP